MQKVTATSWSPDVSPPSFVRLAGHPLRWRLLSELGRSDRRVRELCALIGRPQSLVSYHLGRLRDQGLVSMRRSSADRRDVYYNLDLALCAQSLSASGGALHPGLQLARSSSSEGRGASAVRALREHGIDIAGRRAKPLGEFIQQHWEYVLSLCDRVREVCPEFPARPDLSHWSIPDPARAGETDAQTYPAFHRTTTELATHIPFLLELIEHTHRQPGGELIMPEDLVSVRYMVDDVDGAVDFYTNHFGFTVLSSAPPAFADVVRGRLRLLLSGPASSAGRPMPDGRTPEPGGWNRIHLIVNDLAAEVQRLRAADLTFRNDIVSGPGGQQILLEDPAGNPIELFQPAGA